MGQTHLDAAQSQQNRVSSPVAAPVGIHINTGGGPYIAGHLNTEGGGFTGRDEIGAVQANIPEKRCPI